MEHLSVTEQQAELVRAAPANIEVIQAHALAIFDRLRNFLAESHVQQSWGLSFTSKGNGPSAELSTPFGPIRMDLVPFVDEKGVQGRYVVEKQAQSPLGEVVWRKVWSLRLDSEGRVFQGDEVIKSIPSRQRAFGVDNDIATLALSILYVAGIDLS